jgi:PAS domain S-box-containing protein
MLGSKSFNTLHIHLVFLVVLAVLPLYLFFFIHNAARVPQFECTVLTLAATVAMAIVWVGIEVVLGRWLRLLNQASRQLAEQGNFRVCISKLRYAPLEIRQLARSFNELADSLERQFNQLRHVEAELRRANDRFHMGAAAINATIYEWDLQTQAVERTPGLLKVLGYEPEEAPNDAAWWHERIHPDDFPPAYAVLSSALAGNSDDFEAEYRLRDRYGQYIHVWERGLIVRDERGHPLRIFGGSLDLTERQRVEEQLRQSEAQFRQIAENLREVLWMSTPGLTQILYVNPAYEQMWGRTCESLYAQPSSFLAGIHPEDSAALIAVLEQKPLGTKLLEEFNHEFRIVRPDGSVRWVLSRAFPIHDRAGEVYRIVGLVEDITQRKQAEVKIKQWNETLEQRVRERTVQLELANAELDAFAYSVSHDLRAPLRHIHGFANALAQRLESTEAIADPKIASYIQTIQDSSIRMTQLIDGLLALSRAGRQPLAQVSVSVRELVEAAIALIKSQTPTDRQIEFIVGDLPTIDGDPVLLRQVFANLIDNAVKFSGDRQPARIEIGTLLGDNTTIFVKDNGVGFQMEYAEQMFGAFQRLHSQKEFKGTGIGLAIVQRIIHRHGGKIWAESIPQQGATFLMKFRLS